MKHKAIFLDRDGVINIEKEYLYKIEDFEFIDGLIKALQYMQSLGYLLFIITNQSGIGRGYYTSEDFSKLTLWMIDELKKNNITISQVEHCPHAPDVECSCRKPKTGMIDTILKNFDIDLDNSWLIGDKGSDIECAINSNIKHTIQVRSGHTFSDSKADYVINKLDLQSINTIIKG